MKDAAHSESKKPKLKLGFGIGLGEYTSSLLIGAATGVAGAITTVRSRFDKDVENSHEMRTRSAAHSQKLEDITKDFHDKLKNRDIAPLEEIQINGTSVGSIAERRELVDELNGILLNEKASFRNETKQLILHKWGVRDGFIRGTRDMFERMPKESGTMRAIVISSVVSSIVGAVMTLGFFNGIATRAKINAIDNAVEPEANQPPDQKVKSYKDREALALPSAEPKSYTEKLSPKHDALIDEHPKHASHAEKLAAEASDQHQALAAAR